MHILLVADDATARKSMKDTLAAEGFVLTAVDTAEEAVEFAGLYDYDMLLAELDADEAAIMLHELRRKHITLPAITLAGPDDMLARVKALKAGADDSLAKPVHKDELLARIAAVVRRANKVASSNVVIGDLEINLDAQEVTVKGERLALTGHEFQLLEALLLRRDVVMTKEMLINHLYGGMDEPEIKIIDVYVCKIRKKIKAAGGQNCIETVWGRGYALRTKDEAQAA